MIRWRKIANRRSISLAHRRERWFYLLISPWLFGLVIFQAGPLLGAFLLAFFKWQLPQAPSFVGLEHFRLLIEDGLFTRSLINTSYYALGIVPLGLVLGLGLALLLNRPGRAIPFFRAVFFMPSILTGVATILMWAWVFNPRFGIINTLLEKFGINGPGWLLDEKWAMPALILMSLWNVGVNMLVYLAALQSTSKEVNEAAVLDGAGRWALLRNITLPLISPVTFYLLVVNMIGAFQVFTPTYILTRGGPNFSTLTLPLYIYLNAFSYNQLGYASTLAMVLFVIVLILTIAQFKLAEKWVFYIYAAR